VRYGSGFISGLGRRKRGPLWINQGKPHKPLVEETPQDRGEDSLFSARRIRTGWVHLGVVVQSISKSPFIGVKVRNIGWGKKIKKGARTKKQHRLREERRNSGKIQIQRTRKKGNKESLSLFIQGKRGRKRGYLEGLTEEEVRPM